MIISCKSECNTAIQQQLLGNCVRTWKTKEELRGSGYQELLGIRDLRPGGLFESPRTVEQALASERLGCYFSEYLPIELITIQGELYQSERHLTFFYTHIREQMRFAFTRGQNYHAYGLHALGLLKTYLSPASYDDIQELVDLYPGHVIEFTCCSKDVGDCRGRNAIIWEVRNY